MFGEAYLGLVMGAISKVARFFPFPGWYECHHPGGGDRWVVILAADSCGLVMLGGRCHDHDVVVRES